MAEIDHKSINELASALDAILTELVEYRLLRPAPSRLVKLDPKLSLSAAEKRDELFRRISHDPFEGALLLALQALGKLFTNKAELSLCATYYKLWHSAIKRMNHADYPQRIRNGTVSATKTTAGTPSAMTSLFASLLAQRLLGIPASFR